MSKTIFPQAVQFAKLSELSSDQWRQKRREGVGGSDAAAILGMNKYSSAFDVYLDKTGAIPDKPQNLAMLIGNELEDAVARLWCAETGKTVHRSGFMYANATRPWQLANVDRMVRGENAGLECKTTSSLPKMRQLKNGDFPDDYYAQCVHYMAATGADRWYLAILVLDYSKEFYTFVIERDEEEIAALNEAERAFWIDNVCAGVAPMPAGSAKTEDYIDSKYSDEDPDEVTDLYGEELNIKRYFELDEQIDELERERDGIIQHIKLKMGSAAQGQAHGYTATWISRSRSGGVDTKKLRALHPDIYEKFKKPDINYRCFALKEDKQHA